MRSALLTGVAEVSDDIVWGLFSLPAATCAVLFPDVACCALGAPEDAIGLPLPGFVDFC
jgi:hypothetical protein